MMQIVLLDFTARQRHRISECCRKKSGICDGFWTQKRTYVGRYGKSVKADT